MLKGEQWGHAILLVERRRQINADVHYFARMPGV